MKILFLSSRFPYPLYDGESLRISHFARNLCEDHELHFIGNGTETIPDEATKSFFRVHTIGEKPRANPPSSYPFKLFKTFSPDELFPFDPNMNAFIRKIFTEENFDIVWVPAWEMIPHAVTLKNVPICFDIMDDGVLEHARDLRYPVDFKKWVVSLKRLFVHYCFERKYFPRASFCCLVSERDAEVLQKVCPQANSVVISNGVDLDYFRPLNLSENYPSLIFEGNMSFPPSVDAILYFCSEIFPKILQEIPETRLYIVGKNPSPSVQNLADSNVVVTGFVDDVRPYLDRASVFICPMRKGAGIKNKILQAWAMAKPVVATSLSCGGLTINPGQNILVCDGSQGFASAVVGLLKEKEKRDTLGQEALRTVRQNYSWGSKAKDLGQMMAKAVNEYRGQ